MCVEQTRTQDDMQRKFENDLRWEIQGFSLFMWSRLFVYGVAPTDDFNHKVFFKKNLLKTFLKPMFGFNFRVARFIHVWCVLCHFFQKNQHSVRKE